MPLHLSGVKRWGTGVGCAACGCVLVCFACGPVWWGARGLCFVLSCTEGVCVHVVRGEFWGLDGSLSMGALCPSRPTDGSGKAQVRVQ